MYLILKSELNRKFEWLYEQLKDIKISPKIVGDESVLQAKIAKLRKNYRSYVLDRKTKQFRPTLHNGKLAPTPKPPRIPAIRGAYKKRSTGDSSIAG